MTESTIRKQRCIAEMCSIAESLGSLSTGEVIVACRRFVELAEANDFPYYGDMEAFVLQTDDTPRAENRGLYSPQFLQKLDKRNEAYTARMLPSIKRCAREICESLPVMGE